MKLFFKIVWYHGFRTLFGCAVVLYLRCRWYGCDRLPADGPVLLVANHQSNLDPVLVGVGARRRLCFVAKKPLFCGMFGWSIRHLDAIPIDQEGSSLSGIKGALKCLKGGRAVLIFPEGSRTNDGRLAPILPGFIGLARRSGATIMPLGIDGAYQSWPRNRRFPRPGRIAIQFGHPIPADTIRRLDNEAVLELVRVHMATCFDRAVRHRQRS